MARSRPPVLTSLAGYRRDWLPRDLVAGFTVWAVLVPESLAYATIAGVSPVVGLYAAPPALLLYALFGSSKHMVTGPMAATAALSAAAVADLAAGRPGTFTAFTVMLALATGVLALLAGLFRLGFVANFISEPVLKGFIIGLALTIIVGQVPALLGVSKGSGNFFEQSWDLLVHLGDTQGPTLAVGGISLALVLGLHRLAPVIPGSLVAVVFGIVAVKAFGLADHGVAIVGHIQSGLPAVGLPHTLGVKDFFATTASAVGVMLVGYVEGLGAAKAYAGEHDEIDPDRELISLGAANLGAGLFSGMVVNGSLSKTAVNVSAGVRSQLSGVLAALLTVLTLLFLTGLFADLPEATLAAVVIASLIELVDFAALLRLFRAASRRVDRRYGIAARPDFIAAMAAMLGELVFNTLPGLFIGIAVSLLLLLYRSSQPNVAELGRVPGTQDQFGALERHPQNIATPGVQVLRIEGALFFANSDTLRHAIRQRASREGTRAVVLDAESIPFVDVTAVAMLRRLSDDLGADGVRFVLAHDPAQLQDLFRAAAAGALLAEVYPTVAEAIAAVTPGPPP